MVWFPKGRTKYYDKALRREFHSKKEKEQFLKENKFVEHYTPDSSFKKELKKMHEEVEEGRKSKGLKPRSAEVVVNRDGFYALKYREERKPR